MGRDFGADISAADPYRSDPYRSHIDSPKTAHVNVGIVALVYEENVIPDMENWSENCPCEMSS